MDTFKKTRRLSLWTAALAASAAFAGLAQAEDISNSDAHRLTVRYSDLDVSTVAGAAALYQRLQGAAHFVCGEEGRGLAEQAQWRGCVHSAVGQAVAAVHSPALSAIEAEGGARPLQTALLRR
jgi:UrcA family protein